ncbi:MAG: hypothetical protein ACLSGS_02495 [Adlercreutzia sp.]
MDRRGTRRALGGSGVGSQPFDPFDPFAPFRATASRARPCRKLSTKPRRPRARRLVIAGKVALLAAALAGTAATGCSCT